MKPISPFAEKALLGLTILGFVVPNGIFVYFLLFEFSVVAAAHANPVSAAFIGEAILLMLLCTWFVSRQECSPQSWWVFLLLTLVGSLAFSVPLYLFLYSRSERRRNNETPNHA
jgi:4-amino-4-deoxy-L-arabinose transferase-like glycosyltransferase